MHPVPSSSARRLGPASTRPFCPVRHLVNTTAFAMARSCGLTHTCASPSRDCARHHWHWTPVTGGYGSHGSDRKTRLRCSRSVKQDGHEPVGGDAVADRVATLVPAEMVETSDGVRSLRIRNPWRRAQREAQDCLKGTDDVSGEGSGLDGGSWTKELRDSLQGVGEDGG